MMKKLITVEWHNTGKILPVLSKVDSVQSHALAEWTIVLKSRLYIITLPAVLYSYNSVFMTSIFINCIVIPLMPVVMITGIITAFAGFISLACVFYGWCR